jgi:exopolysaccharide production protein ExoF
MTRNIARLASLSALLAGLMMVPVAEAAEADRAEVVSGELVKVVGAEACGLKAAPAIDRVALAGAKIAAEVRLARLASELQGFETITLSAELEANRAAAPVAAALREEQLVFNAHREMLASKLAAFSADKALKQTEIDLVREKQALYDRQIALAEAQLDRLNTLRDQGLAIASQTLALEQGVLQLEVADDDLKLSVLHAQQEVNAIDRSVADMRAEYRNETLAEVNKTQATLAKLARQAAAPTSVEPRPAADCDASGPTLFVVVRAANGALQAIPVAPAGGVTPAPQLYVAETR